MAASLEIKDQFLVEFPQYGYQNSDAGNIESWRQLEFPSLLHDKDYSASDPQLVYLDHAGATLCGKSQLQEAMTIMLDGTSSTPCDGNGFPFCNPHSSGPSAGPTAETITAMKAKILNMVNGTGKYEVIFTSGATQALQKVAEHFPFTPAVNDELIPTSSVFAHTKDCHTSVLGMRGVAKRNGARVTCLPREATIKQPASSDKTTNVFARATVILGLCSSLNEEFKHDSKRNNNGNEKKDEFWTFSSLKTPIIAMLAAVSLGFAGVSSDVGWKSASFFVAASNASLVALVSAIGILFDDSGSSDADDEKGGSDNDENENDDDDDDPVDLNDAQRQIHHLLVYPAECNFDGVRHELNLPAAMSLASRLQRESQKHTTYQNSVRNQRKGQKNGLGNRVVTNRWWTCLDAAKWCGTSELDLQACPADFVCLSFYKIFGYPSGLGCLLLRSEAARLLFKDRETRYFGGGTLAAALSGSDWQRFRPDVSMLSNGSEHFLGIVSLRAGFNRVAYLGGFQRISQHAHACAALCARELSQLRHLNGTNVISLYGAWPKQNISTSSETLKKRKKKWSYDKLGHLQGPVVTFNVLRPNGSLVGYAEVEKMACLHDPPIQLRTGCFCNPGACQIALDLSDDIIVAQHLEGGHACGDSHDMVNGRPTGAVRLSFGSCSTYEDAMSAVRFIDEIFKQLAPEIDQALRKVAGQDVNESTNQNKVRNDDVNYGNNQKLLQIQASIDEKCKVEEGFIDHSSNSTMLEEMWIYPVKSCGGMRVKNWPIVLPPSQKQNTLQDLNKTKKNDYSECCLLFDRSFAVVDKHSRIPLRTRQHRKLATILPTIDLVSGIMKINAPQMSELIIDLGYQVSTTHNENEEDEANEEEIETFEEEEEEEEETVSVCSNKSCVVIEPHSKASDWFSVLLGIPASLVRVQTKHENAMNSKQKNININNKDHTPSRQRNMIRKRINENLNETFSNEAPFLLVSTESVNFLNDALIKIAQQKKKKLMIKNKEQKMNQNEDDQKKDDNFELISARNFRPNFVVSCCQSSYSHFTAAAHEEDSWKMISMSKMSFNVTGDCSRCAMIEIDPTNGENAAQGALRTLASYRRHHADILFGKYLSCEQLAQFEEQEDDNVGGMMRNVLKRKDGSSSCLNLHWLQEGVPIEVGKDDTAS